MNAESHPVSSTLIDRGVAITASLRPDLEGTFPFIIDRGEGAFVWDRDGQRYLDFTASCGAILLGHRRREVDHAVIEQIRERGTIFPTTLSEPQIQLAERLSSIFPCAERVLFFRTGSCATTAAVRLARVFTGKTKVLTSGYHGWHDWHLQIFPRFRFPDSQHLDFGYNLNLLEELLHNHRGELACIILTPEPTFFDGDYLREVQQIARREGVLLIFDEIVSGFRYGVGGAQAMSGVVPDLATIGKGLANGYGLAAVIGRQDILDARNRTHLVGTYQHEVPPIVAALATTEVFIRDHVAERLATVGTRLLLGLQKILCSDDAPNFVGRFPALFHIIFEHEPQVQRFYAELRARGVLMHPFDCQMLTAAHTEADIDFALAAAAEAWAVAREAHPCRSGQSGLSREALDFRTLHEIGGTVRFRDPLSEIPRTWEQADR
jgi:glutamate-1-semialdehyde aminotransferase